MIARLASARRHVDALRSALLSPAPDELERSLPALAEAVACLRSAEQELRSGLTSGGDGEIRAVAVEANSLRESLAVVRRVVAGSAAFYDGWLRMLGAAAGGYTRAGAPAALTPTATVSVKG
jgi:hypothetical protein